MNDLPFEVDSPCPVEGIDERRPEGWETDYCDHCDETVHNLSEMTPEEAQDFYEEHRGQDVCASFELNDDGEIMHREPGPDVGGWLRRSATTGVGAVALAAGLLAGCEAEAPSGQTESAAVEPIAVEESVARLKSTVNEAVGAARRQTRNRTNALANARNNAALEAEVLAAKTARQAEKASERTACAERQEQKRVARSDRSEEVDLGGQLSGGGDDENGTVLSGGLSIDQ